MDCCWPDLELPARGIPDRVSRVIGYAAGERKTFAELKGPGCIRQLWFTVTRREWDNRRCVIRIYFDDAEVPQVEAPIGDFFGVMHGQTWYPLNTPYLSVKAESGYNCYFPMPFARSARIEFAVGDTPLTVYGMVGWQRYRDPELTEPLRFCARWRRESPTTAYGSEYLLLDADGPGQLLGFVYGVRLIDNVDRWSHGGADNIYIDGLGEQPAYLRGIGGEDTFGASYGGALHVPDAHLYAGMPYYVHEDTGEPRPAQRVVGYRFFTPERIAFEQSLQIRFGCMANDICSTAYWYQAPPVRPFFSLPDWPGLMPRVPALTGGDLALRESGAWWCCGPFHDHDGRAFDRTCPAEAADFSPQTDHDPGHEPHSPWLTGTDAAAPTHARARWRRYAALNGFVDFNHLFRPHLRGPGLSHSGVAVARCRLRVSRALQAQALLAWDDRLSLRLNDGEPWQGGDHDAFRAHAIELPLRTGDNDLLVKLSNTANSNHGGWAFAFQCRTPEGDLILPQA